MNGGLCARSPAHLQFAKPEHLKNVLVAPLRARKPTAGPAPTPSNKKGHNCGPLQGWARVVSNHRPLACEASALPLSYAPLCLKIQVFGFPPEVQMVLELPLDSPCLVQGGPDRSRLELRLRTLAGPA